MSLLPRWSTEILIRLSPGHTRRHISDLWPWRIIGPTCSAARDIHCVVKCTAHGHVCQRSKIMYVCERGRRKQQLWWWVKGECDCVSSFLYGLKLIHVNQDFGPFAINDKSGERGCQHGALNSQTLPPLPSIHPPIYRRNERSSRPPQAAQKLESWLWIYMSV